MGYKKADLKDLVDRLSQNYSDAEITKAFAENWDALAAQATTAKNAATNDADAEMWHDAYRRRNRRALFWWGANTMAPKLSR